MRVNIAMQKQGRQSDVLYVLRNKKLRLKQIARKLKVYPPQIVPLLKILIADGLVERDKVSHKKVLYTVKEGVDLSI